MLQGFERTLFDQTISHRREEVICSKNVLLKFLFLKNSYSKECKKNFFLEEQNSKEKNEFWKNVIWSNNIFFFRTGRGRKNYVLTLFYFFLDFGLSQLTSLQLIMCHVAGFYKPTILQSPPSYLQDYGTAHATMPG